jgi:glycosyltransferase involved in cell wall biosynthesis
LNAVTLLVASAGNEFMVHIAGLLRQGFREAGTSCDILVDAAPADYQHGRAQIVVAPHEYVPLFLIERVRPLRLTTLLEQVYVLNVEQPGSQWFEIAWDYGHHCRGVFDISEEGAREFRRRGADAHHAPIGYSSVLESAVQLAHRDRPIDVLFIGHSSKRRDEFFARHGELFGELSCHVLLSDVTAPRHANTPGYAAGDQRLTLLSSSKILLNIHASDRTYFETHRAMLALANNCLFVSETSRHTAPLVNGEHFIMAAPDDLPHLCRRYANDVAALEAIASSGHRFAKEHLHVRSSCQSVLQRIDTIERDRAAALETRSSRSSSGADAQRQTIIARLADSRSQRSRGLQPWDATPNLAYQRSAGPDVSVIVTLYNYGRFIDQCLTSVLESEALPGPLELVVVDDGSTDDSLERALTIATATSVPMLVVRKHVNTGLAEARNVGLECARSRFVFILDADNWIYPPCLRVLRSAIDGGAYAGVYGVIRRFDDETDEGLGLLSKYEWNVRELIRCPYIDAMAMLDRSAVLNVGGYSTELIEHGWFGWEDYDLWLKLAAAGHSCKLVPSVLSSYRVHVNSMLHRTNQTSEGIARYFHRKFADLLAEYPKLDRYFGFPPPDAPAIPVAQSEVPNSSISELQFRCGQLQARLNEMYASASWRVTAPLRFAYRVLTGRP